MKYQKVIIGKLPKAENDHIKCRTLINGKYILIDDKIRELVKLLNELGYKTEFSCEDMNGEGYCDIIFDPCMTMKEMRELQLLFRSEINFYGLHFIKWMRIKPLKPAWRMQFYSGYEDKFAKVLRRVYEERKGDLNENRY